MDDALDGTEPLNPGDAMTYRYPTPWGDARVDRPVDEVTWTAVVEAMADTSLTPAQVMGIRVSRSYVALTWLDHGERRTIHTTRRPRGG